MDSIEAAKKYFDEKFHCSQAVFAAFAPKYGLPEKQALKIGGSFGGGMCKGEVCGALTGALMVIGLKYGQCDVNDMESRAKTSALTSLMMDRFKAENGSYLCKELLGYDLAVKEQGQKARELGLFTDFCPKMVESAAKILEQILEENK